METQVITSQDYYRTMQMFIDIAAKYPLLNKKQERAMIEKYRNDLPTLKTLLINHNIRIVMNTAKKYVKRTLNPADLLVDGYYGLTIAAERFEIDKNIKFNTYATSWVFKYVVSSFYSKSPEIGVNAYSMNQQISETSDGELGSLINEDDRAAGTAPKPNVEKEMGYFNVKDVMTNVIDKLYKAYEMSPLRVAILNRNLIEGESLAKISAEYNVNYADATAEKRSITSFIKEMLTTEYNVTSLADIV